MLCTHEVHRERLNDRLTDPSTPGVPPSFVSLWPLLWGLPACRLLAPEAPEILGSLQELWTGPDLESPFPSTPTPGPSGLDADNMRPHVEGLMGEEERSEGDTPSSEIRETASEGATAGGRVTWGPDSPLFACLP